MKIACLIASALFVIAAIFQINDGLQYRNDDFWFWIVFYLCTAVLSFYQARRHLPRWVHSTWGGFAIGGALFKMQDPLGNFDFMIPFRAEAIPSKMTALTQAPNETGGLFLVAFWAFFLAWKGPKMSQKPPLA